MAGLEETDAEDLDRISTEAGRGRGGNVSWPCNSQALERLAIHAKYLGPSHVKGKGGWRIANGELVKLADL